METPLKGVQIQGILAVPVLYHEWEWLYSGPGIDSWVITGIKWVNLSQPINLEHILQNNWAGWILG